MSSYSQGADDVASIIGVHEASTLGGAALVDALTGLQAQAPELASFVIRRQLGDLGAEAVLDPREWSIATLAVLAVLGDSADQLGVYATAALLNGATEAEIQDVVNVAASYGGIPRAVTSARAIASRTPDAIGPAHRESVVRLSDHETGVVAYGEADGTPILLLHALCMDRHYWRAVAPTLADQALTLAYDMRAHGKARGAPLPSSLDQMADDAALLLDKLGIERADIYGASYGGAVAQHIALRHPDRVRGLALLATAARCPRDTLRERATKAEAHGMAAQVPESLARWFLPDSIAHNTWGVRYARSRVLRARVEDWATSWRNMADLDVVDQLSKITAPTLVLSGAQDLSSTPEFMDELVGGLPNGKLVSLDPGSHMMVIEQPGSCAQALADFRTDLDARFSR